MITPDLSILCVLFPSCSLIFVSRIKIYVMARMYTLLEEDMNRCIRIRVFKGYQGLTGRASRGSIKMTAFCLLGIYAES